MSLTEPAAPQVLRPKTPLPAEPPRSGETGLQASSPSWRRAISAAVFAFVLSRMLILASAVSAVAVAEQWPGPSPDSDAWQIRLLTPESIAALEQRIILNDAGWYFSIVRDGYEQRPFDASRQVNWAFFPLHPMLWKAVNALGSSPAWSGLALVNLLFLLALIQTHRWVQVMRSDEVATNVVLCVSLFPTAYFFSLPWSESLFLLLSATSLLAIQRKRWGSSTVANALLSATRPTGLLLAALMWWEAREGRRLPPARIWVLAALGGTGLLAFMGLLWVKTGNPLAFADIQAAWGRDGGSLTKHLRRWLMDPLLLAEPWNVRWINNSALVLGLGASIWLWRRRMHGLALFAFFSLLIPWSTGTLLSMGRYLVSCLPVFFAFGCWLQRPRLRTTWLVVSACLLAGMTACYALGANFTGA